MIAAEKFDDSCAQLERSARGTATGLARPLAVAAAILHRETNAVVLVRTRSGIEFPYQSLGYDRRRTLAEGVSTLVGRFGLTIDDVDDVVTGVTALPSPRKYATTIGVDTDRSRDIVMPVCVTVNVGTELGPIGPDNPQRESHRDWYWAPAVGDMVGLGADPEHANPDPMTISRQMADAFLRHLVENPAG